MKQIFSTRWLHWRKQWLSLIIWLLLPIIATLMVVTIANQWQEETVIPIGLVVEDDTTMANDLVQAIYDTELIRVHQMEREQALTELEQHELDSVFVIEQGYMDKIKTNNRKKVITAYVSDMSIAYTPVKESIASYVQQDAGASRAAYTLDAMAIHYNTKPTWTWNEIVATSNQIKQEEALLDIDFSFNQQEKQHQENKALSLWNVWGIWSVFAFLTTFFLFDWVIKEKQSAIKVRLSLLPISFKGYLVRNGLLYGGLLLLSDLINMSLLSMYTGQTIDSNQVLAIIVFRFTICLGAFLIAQCFQTSFYYYVSVLPLTLIMAVIGGAIIPIDGLPNKWAWISYFSPMQQLVKGDSLNVWSIILLVVFFIWYWGKGEKHA
ncbi:ABC transporter permease [Paraliobacillus ryukyuensis]|uniref:ABC transporter permease n=1 Tax=Paraliobacillus ryukyuensis TaxID=200904 RepID=UPI0009A688BF|nr:ABC transporter permease [Paraliobacillus ryukyuensis]